MAYRNRKKRSQKTRGVDSNPPPLAKSQSAPQHGQTVDWPGEIEEKYIEDVRNRLNVLEQTAVSDDMIRAFLAANEMSSRHAVVALKKCVEWRKGRQMFWNNYRSQNERFQFLTQVRKVGRGHASTFGHAKSGRLLFYEKIGENFNMALHKEFTQSEFIDHIIVWCENLLNYALANAGHATHLIHEIPFYEGDEEEAKHRDSNNLQGRPPITPQFDDDNQLELHPKDDDDDEDEHEEADDAFPDIGAMGMVNGAQSNSGDSHEAHKYKARFRKYDIKTASTACKYSDVVGILDWKGLDVDKFIANKELILAAEQVIAAYYPHLINRFYHINMPLNFEKVEEEFKTAVSTQSLIKSVFLESEATKIARMDYMRKYGKKSLKRSLDSRRSLRAGRTARGKKKASTKQQKQEQKDPDEPPTDLPELDEDAKKELAEQVPVRYLAKEYGGECESAQIYTFVDSIYRDLVGVSAEPDPDGYEEFMNEETEELKSWKKIPLRSLERHTERLQVKRGEHYIWQYTAEFERKLIFGATFEAEGFRGKAIKIIVREETEQTVGYWPMFGDFIVLKDGNLVFQFRNIKGGKRLTLQYKIHKEVFPQWFVNKHLPDYHAEERLLQSSTLNIGGKSRYASSSHRSKSNKSPSEYSGSTALSTSPPPDLHSLRVRSENEEDKGLLNGSSSHKNLAVRRKSKSTSKRSKTPQPQTPTDPDDAGNYPNKKKRSVKHKKKAKSMKKRSRTPNPPHSPNTADQDD